MVTPELSSDVVAQAGERLDRVVQARFPEVPRAGVLAAFADGLVSIGGRVVAKGRRARAGDQLRVERLAEAADFAACAEPGSLDVVYEDAVLLAFDKPGGQNCHPLAPGETGTLVNAMLARHPELVAVGGDSLMPALLHRIDAGTSGLVLAARTDAAYAALRRQFLEQTVTKTYLATVKGVLARGIGKQLRAGVELDDGPARVDDFAVVDKVPGKTLVRLTLHEGRKRIVRRLLAAVGYPVQELVRTDIGPIALGNQRPGSLRVLDSKDVGELYKAVGM